MKSILLKTLFFFFIAFQAQAQELLPFVENYNKSDYQGDNQIWNVAQGKDNAMYFANNHYLLRYNGVKWEKYLLPNKTIIRSILVDGDKIYSGSYKEFGYWNRKDGKMNYVSISKGNKVFDENIFSDYDFFKTLTINKLERIDLFKNSGDWYDEGCFYTPFFAKTLIKSQSFEAILRAVADDEIRVFFLNTSTNTIIAPYDGGVDVILKDIETMLFYKEKYKNWLSERADGL